LKVHPDKVIHAKANAAAAVSRVREAWRVLSNATLRQEYDQKLKGTFTPLLEN
jgi:curved DNA-binding protein CbpA